MISLQNDINNLVEKCKCMHIGRDKNHHSYQIDQYMLEHVKEEKANSNLRLIKRSFVASDEDTLPLLFTSMVRPHLEYANILWGPPHFICDIRAL